MSDRKNYNSIVFLTTLSLYLGLVLAGGAVTPTVLAQAATTRNFDIKSEVVIEDDLEKKPDDCQSLEKLFRAKPENAALLDFAATLKSILLISEEISSTDYWYRFGAEPYADYRGYRNVSFAAVKFQKGGRENLSKEVHSLLNLFEKEADSKLLNFTFDYARDEKGLTTRVAFLQEKDFTADNLPLAYGANFGFPRCAEPNNAAGVILKNTQVTFENNQVFIVTRLPRASIDDLLAKN